MLALSSDVLHFKDVLLGRLQHSVQPAQDRHRQDDIPILATYIEVPEYIVSDAPNEVGNPVQIPVAHDVGLCHGYLSVLRECDVDSALSVAYLVDNVLDMV
jgi:hypothetical protein